MLGGSGLQLGIERVRKILDGQGGRDRLTISASVARCARREAVSWARVS